ncbi:uncharacterized protein LOC144235672 [Crocuta crocuta]
MEAEKSHDLPSAVCKLEARKPDGAVLIHTRRGVNSGRQTFFQIHLKKIPEKNCSWLFQMVAHPWPISCDRIATSFKSVTAPIVTTWRAVISKIREEDGDKRILLKELPESQKESLVNPRAEAWRISPECHLVDYNVLIPDP